jgi:hypothetical protein
MVAFSGLVEIDDYYIFAEVYTNEWEGKPRCLPAALRYAAKGWRVFPAPRGEKKSHKSAEHSGGRKWGATDDPNEIERDFARWPEANVGIPTGADNGFWVLEADTKDGHSVDGIGSLRALEEQHGKLPDTLTAESPSGSIHYYFKRPAGREIRNSASTIAPGVDVRGEGGMVIAPPSVKAGTLNGAYTFTSNFELAEAPDWLVDMAAATSGGNCEYEEREPNSELEAANIEVVAAAVEVIPNPDLDWESWNTIGMAIFAATGGSSVGLAIFDRFSQKSAKYKKNGAKNTLDKWRSFHSSPPNRIGMGSLHHWATEADPGWLSDCDDQAQAEINAAGAAARLEASEPAASTKVEQEHPSDSGNGQAPPKSESKSESKSETRDGPRTDERPSGLVIVRVSDVESKRYNWLWKPRIARGKLALLVGMPDVSKSTFALDLITRITHGSALPNDEGLAPLGSAIILSAEDDVADTVRPRLEVAGADLERVHVITAVDTKQGGRRTFDLGQDIKRLEREVLRIGDVNLIVVDPFSAYMGKPGKIDTFRSTDVRSTLAPLQDMAARLEVAVLGIGHLNKSGSMTALMRVLDSVAFVAAARGVYIIVRDPEDDERRLFLPVKNNIGKIRTGLSFRIVEKLAPPPVFDSYPALKWEDGAVNMTADEALAWKDDGRRSEAAEKAKRLILEMLANGAVRQRDVQAKAAEQQIGARSLRTAKVALGIVSTRAEGAWWWSLPSQPRPM